MTIQNKLYELQDLKYQKFSSSLLPGVNNIIGVRLPVLRKLSKTCKLTELTDNTFEEVMLQGMIIGHIKELEEFICECKKFLSKINNWSICDSFVYGLNITKRYELEILEFLKSLVSSSHDFTRRFVLVMLLKYYLKEEYIDITCTILSTINKQEYYVEMAYAWCLAEMYVKFPTLVLRILNDEYYNIDINLLRKIVSKIKESKKISQENIRKVQIILNLRRENL